MEKTITFHSRHNKLTTLLDLATYQQTLTIIQISIPRALAQISNFNQLIPRATIFLEMDNAKLITINILLAPPIILWCLEIIELR